MRSNRKPLCWLEIMLIKLSHWNSYLDTIDKSSFQFRIKSKLLLSTNIFLVDHVVDPLTFKIRLGITSKYLNQFPINAIFHLSFLEIGRILSKTFSNIMLLSLVIWVMCFFHHISFTLYEKLLLYLMKTKHKWTKGWNERKIRRST